VRLRRHDARPAGLYEKVGAEKYGAEAANLLYNGPFIMESWVHEQNVVLKKNPNYWNASKITIQEVQYDMITDTQASFTKFLAGDYDVTGLGKSDYWIQSEAAGFETKTFSDGATFYLEFNLKDPSMANKKIRQALCYALDRKSYISKIMKDKSIPALAFVNPEIRGATKTSYREEAGDLIKDNQSEEAKKLYAEGLAELGVDKISVSIISDDSDLAKSRAEAMAESMKKNLGIEISVDSMPFKSRLEKMSNGEFQMVYAGWGPDYNDPMTFLDMFETGNGNNHTSYSSAEYDKLLADARKTMDNKKRYEIYKQMEKLLLTDMPIAPIFFRIRAYTTRPEVKGITRSAFQDMNYLYAYIEAQ
jgi:oligopeptide transport system substrate-binding protein